MVMTMDSRFNLCLKEGKLVKIGVQPDLVTKEADAAAYDLQSAEKSLEEGNPNGQLCRHTIPCSILQRRLPSIRDTVKKATHAFP